MSGKNWKYEGTDGLVKVIETGIQDFPLVSFRSNGNGGLVSCLHDSEGRNVAGNTLFDLVEVHPCEGLEKHAAVMCWDGGPESGARIQLLLPPLMDDGAVRAVDCTGIGMVPLTWKHATPLAEWLNLYGDESE